mgnify:FL=1
MAIKPVNEEHKKAIVASRKRKANNQKVTSEVQKVLNKYEIKKDSKGTDGSTAFSGKLSAEKGLGSTGGKGSGSTAGKGGGNTNTGGGAKGSGKVNASSGSKSKSKLAALNTQKRRDQYTARGWAQDATTKLKSNSATGSSSTKDSNSTPASKPAPAATTTNTTVKINPFSSGSGRKSTIGDLNVKVKKPITAPAPTVGTPRQEQRKVKQAEVKANRASNKASRVLNRENKKATRDATKETNQARKAVKKSLKNLGGTRKEKKAQFEAGKPTASVVASKGVNQVKDSYGNKPIISAQSKIPSVNRGSKPESLTNFLSSSSASDSKTMGVLQSDKRTGGGESLRGKYFGSAEMQASQKKYDANNPISMRGPIKMVQNQQGVMPAATNPFGEVNQMNANFNPQAQQRAQQMQMTNQQSPMFKKDFPDLNKDGKITKADILMGRGVKK